MRNIVGFVVTVAISARCGRFRPGNSSVAPTLSFLAFCFPITVSIQIAVLLYPTYCHSTFWESASRHVTALSISKVSLCLSLSVDLKKEHSVKILELFLSAERTLSNWTSGLPRNVCEGRQSHRGERRKERVMGGARGRER